MKIISEDQAVESRTTELLADWEKGKPVAGNTRPDAALSSLTVYEGKFSRLKEDRDNVAKAKEALELMEPGACARLRRPVGRETRCNIARICNIVCASRQLHRVSVSGIVARNI